MLASGSVYQTELGRINIQIDHCEANIRRLEARKRKLEETLDIVREENRKLGKHIEGFKTNLIKVEHWNSLKYWDYVEQVNTMRRLLSNYKHDVDEAIKAIRREIGELNRQIYKEKNKKNELTTERSKVRKKLEEAKASKNSLGSGTY